MATFLSTEYGESDGYLNLGLCLDDEPPSLLSAVCGNGLVEAIEECDCGDPLSCAEAEPFCNATSCKFVTGAECSSGICCDSSTGKFRTKASAYLCRSATHSVCDYAEICDGVSSECPADTVAPPSKLCTTVGASTLLSYDG